MKTITQRSLFKSSVAAFLTGILTCSPMVPLTATHAAEAPMELLTGDIETIPVSNLTRVSITDPTIADISDAQADKVLVLGKKPGQTIVFVWDDQGKRSVVVRVINEDLNVVKTRIQTVLDKTGYKNLTLEVNPNEGKVVVSGALSKQDRTNLDHLLEPYAENVLNLVKEEVSDDLVQIDMQVVELSTTVTKNLGIDWGNSISTSNGGQNGQTSTTNAANLNYTETLPSDLHGPNDWFKIGQINRTSAIQATINTLILEGKGRILSKPRLVVLSGKEASFLVGGEIPIQSTQTSASGGTTTTTESFKQYGVNMTITPTLRNGKVDILLNVQISDIDRANQNQQTKDVAFITRQVQTQLYLDNGQTIVMAGLIKHSDGDTVKKVPFLGSIPIIGLAFRNRYTPTPNGDTELVISLTPRVLRDKKYAEKEMVYPTPGQNDLIKEVDSHYQQQPLKYPEVKTAMGTSAPGGTNGSASMTNGAPAAGQGNGNTTMKVSSGSVVTKTVSTIAQGGTTIPYARMIQEKISQGITYPYEALQNNWQGTVKLKLHILKDGTLATADVLESSGHDVFDNDALNTAKIVAPYPAFPADMTDEDLVVTIPIVYSQGASK